MLGTVAPLLAGVALTWPTRRQAQALQKLITADLPRGKGQALTWSIDPSERLIPASVSGGSRHATAFVCTALAGGRTFLAMAHLMLTAFLTAGLADVCTLLANRLGKFTTPSHIASGKAAYLCAIHDHCYAARHHLDILLLQAGRRAKVAGVSACVTGFNTGGVLLVGHYFLLFMVKRNYLDGSIAGT